MSMGLLVSRCFACRAPKTARRFPRSFRQCRSVIDRCGARPADHAGRIVAAPLRDHVTSSVARRMFAVSGRLDATAWCPMKPPAAALTLVEVRQHSYTCRPLPRQQRTRAGLWGQSSADGVRSSGKGAPVTTQIDPDRSYVRSGCKTRSALLIRASPKQRMLMVTVFGHAFKRV